MALSSRLKKEALALSQKAMERLFADEKRAMAVANAIGKVQKGKAALDQTQAEVMRQLSLAPKQDFKAIGKQLSALKRRIRDLEEKLDQVSK